MDHGQNIPNTGKPCLAMQCVSINSVIQHTKVENRKCFPTFVSFTQRFVRLTTIVLLIQRLQTT
jgi:hypothetical protein